MHGDGTKLGTTAHNSKPRLLDLTRLISRAGHVATGVDRVELAYLRRFLSEDVAVSALVRTTLGYVLLDRDGMRRILNRVDGSEPWGPVDALSWVACRKRPEVRRAESDLRRFATARCLPRGLSKLLNAHLPKGFVYFNIGHSNLSVRTLSALRRQSDAYLCIFVHDALPLDYPHYQRPGTAEKFRAKLQAVQAHADLLIFNSDYTKHRVQAHMSGWGPAPDCVVAPLGVDPVQPDAKALSSRVVPKPPYFVTVGTIEPRKRYDLLLDVWDDLVAQYGKDKTPQLFVCGSRGWNNQAVFDRLDALPADHPVRELPGLSDPAIAALVRDACAMIFPSDAEGYGLPPIEATCLGTPVICQELPVYRETLSDIPVYLTAPDRYLLIKLVQSLLSGSSTTDKASARQGFVAPDWDDHFDRVFGSQ